MKPLTPPSYDGSQPLLVANREDFAQAVVRYNNLARAYRETYTASANSRPRAVWEMASTLARIHEVSVRIDWLRAQALERSQISVQALMRDLYDIATADPSELTQMRVTACRHCHGPGFKYQWRDAAEYAAACDEAAANKKPLPDCEGGFEFDALAEPNALCPYCYGVGERQVWVADTSNLSEKGRKLFKGVKQKADGSIEILMHDQLAARDQLHKLAGAYKETVRVPQPTAAEDNEPMTPEKAERQYLELVRSSRVA